MPEFKTREEYEKWKAQRLEDIKSRGNTAGRPDKGEYQPKADAMDGASSGSFRKTIGKVIIVLLIFLAGALLYSLLPKDRKHDDTLIPKSQAEPDSIRKSADTVANTKEPASLSQPAVPKSWADIVHRAKKSVVSVKTANSVGSGFIISPDGMIITNSHVIRDITEVEVIFNSNVSKKASIVKRGTIPIDIAILKVAGENFEYLTLADSNYCKEGEEVMAIGAPYSLSGTVTKGIISNCNRRLKDEFQDIAYIQTDTPISPGNSGGPLINKNGEVIGMLTWKIVKKGVEGLNFAIASNVISRFKGGHLDKVEESAKKVYEEKSKIISSRIDRLEQVWMNEYSAYYNKVAGMVARGAISVEHGTQLLSRATAAPSGFTSVSEWLASLADSVIKEEITESQAHVLIRNSFIL